VEEQALTAMIRDRVIDGVLPREKCQVTWFGYGKGRPCAACDQPILAADVEVECDLPKEITFRFHRQCFDLWDRTRQDGSPGDAEP
jgi:hypothetical protein